MSDNQTAGPLSASVQSPPLNERSWYPIAFMLGVSIVFIGLLALFYRSNEPRIRQAQQQAFRSQILSLFTEEIGSVTGLTRAELLSAEELDQNYLRFIKPVLMPDGSPAYYRSFADGIMLGYCFDIKGNGLWGTMRALVAMKPDLMTVINLSVYDQMETPGLGARITEDKFRDQFAGKVLYEDDKPVFLTLVPEDAVDPYSTEIRQVTGATITSRSVLDMLYTELTYVRNRIRREGPK